MVSGKLSKRLFLTVVVLVLGCDGRQNGLVRTTGQVEGVAVTAGSRIGGRVVDVLVQEGESVRKGDVLLHLDDAEAQALVAAAVARLAGAEAVLAKLEAGATSEQVRQAEAGARAAEERYRMAERGARGEEIRVAKAALDATQAQRDTARTEFGRVKRLLDKEIVTQHQFDQAQMTLDTAEAHYRATREKWEMVTKGARAEEIAVAKALFDQAQAAVDEIRKGAREEDLAAARAARDAAKADLSRAQVGLREMTVVAPLDGVVEAIDVKPGDLVAPGPVVRLVDPDDLEVLVYVSAALLGQLRLGQIVNLTTDSHGDTMFEGRIVHIATQGEYTPRNLQTQEERVQQVFGVKLKLDSHGGKIRAGMTVTAHIPKDAESR